MNLFIRCISLPTISSLRPRTRTRLCMQVNLFLSLFCVYLFLFLFLVRCSLHHHRRHCCRRSFVRSAPVEYVAEEVFLLSFRIVNLILFLFAYKVFFCIFNLAATLTMMKKEKSIAELRRRPVLNYLYFDFVCILYIWCSRCIDWFPNNK